MGRTGGYAGDMARHPIVFRFLADLVRLGAAVSVVAALVGIPYLGAGPRFLLVLLALLVPRAVGGVSARLDLAFCTTVLAAAWLSTASWFGSTPVVWLAHAATAGVTAVVLFRVLAWMDGSSTGRGPEPSRAVVVAVTAALGLGVGAVWEAYRWLEQAGGLAATSHSAAEMAVHLVVDLAGGLLAGLLLAAARHPGRKKPAAEYARRPVLAGDLHRPIL